MRFYLILLLVSFAVNNGSACTCYGFAYFCDAVSFSLQHDPDHTLVVRGIKVQEIQVTEYQTDAIFEILESYINPKGLKSIRMIDGNGANCLQGMDRYSHGTELIFHAYLRDDPETGAITGAVSSCEPRPLEVSRGKVQEI